MELSSNVRDNVMDRKWDAGGNEKLVDTTLENCSHGSHKGHSGLNTISNSSGNERGILDGFENCIGR